MPDLSCIPLGTGVQLYAGLNKTLNYLFDLNRPTYKITSSASEWCLIYIRAVKTEHAAAWSFTLESDTVANVAKVYDSTDPAYDPPRIVNADDQAVPVSNMEFAPVFAEYIPASPTVTQWIVPGIKDINDGQVDITIETQRKYRRHTIEEVGTYIMPIAYHRATDAGLDIRQVARSDWAFWPVPLHAVWHSADEIIAFSGSTNLPPS